jgi:hypothetical protein
MSREWLSAEWTWGEGLRALFRQREFTFCSEAKRPRLGRACSVYRDVGVHACRLVDHT